MKKFNIWIYKNDGDEYFTTRIFSEGHYLLFEKLEEKDFVGKVIAYGNDAFLENYAKKLQDHFWVYKRGFKLPDGIAIKRISKSKLLTYQNEYKLLFSNRNRNRNLEMINKYKS